MQNPHQALLLDGRALRRKRGVMQNHPPAVRREDVYVGGEHRRDGLGSARHREGFVHAVNRQHLSLVLAQFAGLYLGIGPVRKNIRKARPNRREPRQPRPLRMDANDTRFIGPDRHHQIEVRALERIVKRGLAIGGSRK